MFRSPNRGQSVHSYGPRDCFRIHYGQPPRRRHTAKDGIGRPQWPSGRCGSPLRARKVRRERSGVSGHQHWAAGGHALWHEAVSTIERTRSATYGRKSRLRRKPTRDLRKSQGNLHTLGIVHRARSRDSFPSSIGCWEAPCHSARLWSRSSARKVLPQFEFYTRAQIFASLRGFGRFRCLLPLGVPFGLE